MINWDALATAYKEIPSSKCQWASKRTLGHFSHGKNMARWKFHLLAACPRCRVMLDNKDHVILCPNPSLMQVWEMSLKQLKEWLQSQNTYWPIAEAILQGLTQWCNYSMLPTTPMVDGWADQEKIGWSGLLDGKVACSWGTQQGQVWLVSQSCKSSKKWTMELIKKLLNVAWDIWEHCNGALHNSPDAQQHIMESLVNNAIRDKYVQGTHILPQDAMHSSEADESLILVQFALY